MNDIIKVIAGSLSTTTLILGGIALFREYLFAYTGEKAKNLAQKEDIEELTEKVQKISSQYSLQNNAIEQKLSHLYSLQSTHRDEERAAIVEYYENYVHWMYTILEIPIDYYTQATLPLLAEKKKELDEYFLSINKASAKMILLVKNEELIDVQNEMILELINFKGWTDGKLLNLQFDMEKWNRITERFSRLIKNMENNLVEARSIADEETELMGRLDDNRKSYKMEKVQEFVKCKALAHKFAHKAKAYITSIE